MNLCIYHADCPDGWGSAYIVNKRWPGIELFKGYYGQRPPDVKGRRVIMVDFSYKPEAMAQIAADADSLVIIDHHKTAAWLQDSSLDISNLVFDLEHSGAFLTWTFCFPNADVPWWVRYVEDRDLWRWRLIDSKEINGYIMTLPSTIEAWAALERVTPDQAMELGVGVRMQINHYVDKVVDLRQHGTFHGHSCAIVNAAYPNISDVGHELRKHADVAIIYFVRSDGMMQFSVYPNDGIDASELAKLHGGGGHKGATGFQLPLQECREVVDAMLAGGRSTK